MTAAESSALDLPGRMNYQHAVVKNVLPTVTGLSTFAGAWVDAASDGHLVVALTSFDAATEAAIQGLLPSSPRGIRVVRRSHTEAALKQAFQSGRDRWEEWFPNARLESAGIDTPKGALKFGVSPGNLDKLSRFQEFAALLGVPASVEAVEPGSDTVCTYNDCINPMKAGAAIHKTVVSGYPECTMAFQINVGGDKQFLTAGHCGYAFAGNWVHTGITIGKDQADMYYDNGVDIMRIQLPDAQAGFNAIDPIYPNHQVGGWATAVVGFAVRASKSRTQAVGTGTITDQFYCWVSNTANPDIDVCGADSSLTSNFGDSGSPIYYPWQDPGGPPYLAAIGTLSNIYGNLAKIEDALSPLNFTIYTPCGGSC